MDNQLLNEYTHYIFSLHVAPRIGIFGPILKSFLIKVLNFFIFFDDANVCICCVKIASWYGRPNPEYRINRKLDD